VLLFSVGVVADEGEHIGGEFDFQAFGFDSSSDEFEGCGDGGGFRAADAVDAGDVVRGEEHALFVDDLDDLLRQRRHVVFLRASAQNDGEQLLIGEERRSLFEELFSGAFGELSFGAFGVLTVFFEEGLRGVEVRQQSGGVFFICALRGERSTRRWWNRGRELCTPAIRRPCPARHGRIVWPVRARFRRRERLFWLR